MILDEWTINVLNNFNTINPNIVIRDNPGNEIKTISESETIYAVAKVTNTFPEEVSIFNLTKFLGVLNLGDTNEVEFCGKNMIISNENGTCTFSYCNPTLIKTPSEKAKIKVPDTYAEFVLKKEILKELQRAMNILGCTELSISGDGEKLMLHGVNLKNVTSDMYSIEIGETDKTFSCYIEIDKLRMMAIDYKVSVSKAGAVIFSGLGLEEGQSLDYLVGAHKNSKFGE